MEWAKHLPHLSRNIGCWGRGCQVTHKFIQSCVVCRRIKGDPYTTGSSPDLPAERGSLSPPPPSHTRIDFVGPPYVNPLEHSDSQEKAYECLFMLAQYIWSWHMTCNRIIQQLKNPILLYKKYNKANWKYPHSESKALFNNLITHL